MENIQLNIENLLEKYDQENKLELYFSVLKEENKKLNLVSRETIESKLLQLAAESLLPFEYIKQKSFDNYIDIGSGGGMPSFPIILTHDIKQSTQIGRAHV